MHHFKILIVLSFTLVSHFAICQHGWDTLSVDSGIMEFSRFNLRFKGTSQFVCIKTFKADTMAFTYVYDSTYISRELGDTFRLGFHPTILKYYRSDSSLFWNNFKLIEYKLKAIDTIANIACKRYLYDEEFAEDEELTFYFSPDYGLLEKYSNTWGNPSYYNYLSGPLTGLDLNMKVIVPKKKKKRKSKK